MLNRLLTAPMVFALSVKCGFMGMMLKAAREQTRDASEIGCVSCVLSESGCNDSKGCQLKKFKDRELLILGEIASIRERIAKLRNADV